MKISKKTLVLFAAMTALLWTSCDLDEPVDTGTTDVENDDYSTATVTIEPVKIIGTSFTGSEDNTIWKSDADTIGDAGVFSAAREITISDYYLCKYEVTKAQFKAIMSDTTLNTLGVDADPSDTTTDPATYKIVSGEINGDRPVENVTWYDAIYFCNLLSKKYGYTEVYTITSPSVSEGHITGGTVTADSSANGWRLPTEIEWEFAARGGDITADAWNYEYAGSDSSFTDKVTMAAANSIGKYIDSALDTVGWYAFNTCNKGVSSESYPSTFNEGYGPHQVGLLAANSLGLYDMCGNVDEWCSDWWESPISVDTALEPRSSSVNGKVFRGGSCFVNAFKSSVTAREYARPSEKNPRKYTDTVIGFRLARNID